MSQSPRNRQGQDASCMVTDLVVYDLGATNEPNIVNYSPVVTSYGLILLKLLLAL